MSIPTHEDATLLLKLVRMRHEPAFQEAEGWFLREFRADDWAAIKQRYQPGSGDEARMQRVLGYWEMVGALIDHGLLSEDLLFDVLGNLDPIWERVTPWLAGARAELGAEMWENTELLVERQRHWRRMRRPKAGRL